MAGRGSFKVPEFARRSPETVDWILVGLCTLIWLVLLGMSVAAGVALVDLHRGFHKPAHGAHTGLLYIVIGISALIVLGTIPVLLRARRTTPARPAVRPPGFPVPDAGGPAVRPDAGAPLRSGAHIAPVRPSTPVALVMPNDDVGRVWLRGTTELVSAIGIALIAVALATYLMAVGRDTASWVAYGVAGLVTVVMPVVPWRHLRQLTKVLAAADQTV
ncbi:MAG TPA: DUF2561 family protein [Mycobacterium sp.]|nr:DUF2561 family protein [Mycobacterium sp.]